MTTTSPTAGRAMDVEDLKVLLQRVRAATGPDNHLNQMLFAHFRGWSYPLHGAASAEYRRLRREVFYTESFDAAEHLVDEALPGAFFLYARGRTRADEPLYACELLFGTDEKLGEAEHECGPLAVCAALLQALIARAEGGRHAE